MKFTKKEYYQEVLSHINLSDETLPSLEFEECTFDDCSFINTKFIACKFITCKFKNCSISATSFTDCRCIDITFITSKIIGIDWTKAQTVDQLTFETSQLNYSSFKLLKLPKLKLINCEAKEVDFTEADLHESIFTTTDFQKSLFSQTILTKADFRGAKNYYLDARSNKITQAHFSLPEALTLLDSLDVSID